ncbi:hypothetical protein ACWD4B_32710 [Streptomyces sp. NPDC002536]
MKTDQQHEGRFRARVARRASAVVALALGAALLAAPAQAASANSPAQSVQQAAVAEGALLSADEVARDVPQR